MKKIILSLFAIGVVFLSSYAMHKNKRKFEQFRQPQSEDRQCYICFEEIPVNENYAKIENCTCTKKFHQDCLDKWLTDKFSYQEEISVDDTTVFIDTNPEEKNKNYKKGCPVCKQFGELVIFEPVKDGQSDRKRQKLQEDHGNDSTATTTTQSYLNNSIATTTSEEEKNYERAIELSLQDEQRRQEGEKAEEEEIELAKALSLSLENEQQMPVNQDVISTTNISSNSGDQSIFDILRVFRFWFDR
ncbi:hypothetical protein GF322_02755 [Candidatus Dependentiae bacterium]|nr:hypothetical protein [Candidatus Dependentiae bacterium]